MGVRSFFKIFKTPYGKNEYCKFKKCTELPKRIDGKPNKCSDCEAYKFHDYLNNNNYRIFK